MLQIRVYAMLGGETLVPNQELRSSGGNYRLLYQEDGDLVIYGGDKAVWSTGTCGKPAWKTIMQDDGNFVVYAAPGKPIWATNTAGNPNSRLVMQNDGDLVMYDIRSSAIWASENTMSEG